ncbi:MAG: GIY-YIG nuclease family protein [Selenomonadaceae bacterium]|nr:GIY-YIG nuclease family protein [Selenomonadaceae bacterium]MBR3747866.1 GIY-YIG nuclease family protein [Selenomonadaceae bacterium]MBR4384101.1 GIY-YIG nuclease family protein [Selenomonadaceae bacterium]
MEIFGTVYVIINMVNGKMYVGQTTKTLKERFEKHRYAESLIGSAIRRHGKENFRCHVLKKCASRAEMNSEERRCIAMLNTKAPNGYNLADGGEGAGSGHSPSKRGYTLFKNLLIELDARRMTYESLAKLLGLSKQTISDKMHDRVRFTTKDKVKLVEIFGKPIEYLLWRDNE